MKARLLFTGLCAALVAMPALGQQATEMYIPIGASPGVSGSASIIGSITEVTADGRTILVTDGGNQYRVSIPEKTPIWLDRSKGAGANWVGSLADLKTGLRVEVKYREANLQPSVAADWIKVGAAD